MALWLSLFRGGCDFRTPLLVEQHRPYDGAETSRRKRETILLLRGDKSQLSEFERQIWTLHYPSAVVFDCRLHQYRDLPPAKAGPLAANLTQLKISTARGMACNEVAEHFYTNALLPICAAVVFIEDEHSCLSRITARLALWTDLASANTCFHFRPIVLIVSSRLDSSASGRIEEEILTKLLQNHNACREMSFKMAKSRFRSCFGGVVVRPPVGSLASNVRDWSDQIRESDGSMNLSDKNLETLLCSLCKQFAADSTRSFCFEKACLLRQPCNLLTLQAQRLANMALQQPFLYEDVIFIISHALLLHTRQCGPNFARRANSSAIANNSSSSEWFDENYSEVLAQAMHRGIRIDIKKKFVELNSLSTLPVRMAVDNTGLQYMSGGACLSCLSYSLSSVIPCGHELCDSCIRIHGISTGTKPNQYALERCPYCQQRINFNKLTRPPGAGLRILSLTGNLNDARDVAKFLKRLRSNLCGRLDDYFDLVVCNGIGAFFAVMLFCQRATIEDCIHHLPKLDRINLSKTEFIFGKSLRFPRSSLKRSTIYIVEPPLQYARVLCNTRIRVPEPLLQAICGTSTRTEFTQDTLQRLRSSEKIDVLAQSDSLLPESAISVARELLASLFYVESHAFPACYTTPRTYLGIIILCRITASQHFKEIATKFRRQKTHLYVEGGASLRTSLLIDEQTWEDILRGKPFRRELYIAISSPSEHVHIKVDSSDTCGTCTIYSGPANAIHVGEQQSSAKASLKEQIRLLEESLTVLI